MPGTPSAVCIAWHLDQTRADARTATSVPPALDPNEDDGPMTHLGVDTTQEQRCEASGLYWAGIMQKRFRYCLRYVSSPTTRIDRSAPWQTTNDHLQ